MNIVYYLVSSLLKAKEIGISGGHGYSYDQAKESKRKLIKDATTGYGYYVSGNYQSIPVDPVMMLSGRTLKQTNEVEAFFVHLVELFKHCEKTAVDKLLVITNSNNGFKVLTAANIPEKLSSFDIIREGRAMYKALGDKVIIDLEYYAKGGEGCKQAHKQMDLAQAMLELPTASPASIEELTVKDFKNPENDFNKLVCASRWFFNTGDRSEFHNVDEHGYRTYEFGRIDPAKKYYGKPTPDVYYSSLFTKNPIVILDKLYDFCKSVRQNPNNILSAADVDMVKSKEISRIIDTIPGTVKDNELIASMAIAGKDNPTLVDFIDPPGLCYRIRDFQHELKSAHTFFMKRDEDGVYGKQKFVDITDKLFEKDAKGKWKIHADFTNNTLVIPVMIEAPGCVKPVKINISIRYDIPDRSALNSLINNKVEDFKVYLGLDFGNEKGVRYYTVVQTPDYNYIHCNSTANLRVYSLKELGIK